jgi:hypothetical protein
VETASTGLALAAAGGALDAARDVGIDLVGTGDEVADVRQDVTRGGGVARATFSAWRCHPEPIC